MSIYFLTNLRPQLQQLYQDHTWDQRQANRPIVTRIIPLILLYAEPLQGERSQKKVATAPRKNLKGIKPVEGRFRHVKDYVKDQAQTEPSLF